MAKPKQKTNVTKDWTIEQVLDATEQIIETDGVNDSDPTLPIYQWDALQKLDLYQQQYESGDEFVLLLAIRKCANHGLVMPEWIVKGYIHSFDKILNCRCKTLDEAFSSPFPKGSHLNALRKKRVNKFTVYMRVKNIHQKGQAIDEQLFSDVGKELGLGKTLVSEYYYEARSLVKAVLPQKNEKLRK